MSKDENWTIDDLVDTENQDFPREVKIAREMLEVLKGLDETNINIRVPRAANDFIENTLSDWFEVVAEIEKKKGNLPYLIDRELYTASRDGGTIAWNQGLTTGDIKKWLGDWGTGQMAEYPFHKLNKVTRSEEPLSGYFNRLFPVKFVMRIMVILILNSEAYNKEEGWDVTMEGEDPVTLKELREVSATTASYAREWLKGIDVRSGVERGSEFSVGFPEDEKSRERFVAQFVGSKRKNKLSGSIFEMGFANIPSLGPFMAADDLYLTNEGWNFAVMENPLLDDVSMEAWKSGTKFSENEVIFILKHFRKNIPAEWAFINEILNLINSGVNKPKSVEESLIKSRSWDKAHASMMRNGVLSRLQELELIDRKKEGRNVTYFLTERGEKLLSLDLLK